MPRICLVPPPAEVEIAATMLQHAAAAHLRGDRAKVLHWLNMSNMGAIRAWTESAWGKQAPRTRPKPMRPQVAAGELDPLRNAGAALKRQLHERDGYRCRYCGAPVIRAEVRRRLAAAYPEAKLWGRTNSSQHAALQAMWAQYDHLLPHAHSGRTSLHNMVVSCAPCNFGRMQYLLSELDLQDPLSRAVLPSPWDGLEGLLRGPVSKTVQEAGIRAAAS